MARQKTETDFDNFDNDFDDGFVLTIPTRGRDPLDAVRQAIPLGEALQIYDDLIGEV